jgi:cell division protein FtsX
MYSGLIIGHAIVIIGCILIAFNLTSWYRDIMAEIKGQSNRDKTRWTDGLALLSGLLLIAGGACYIVHWIIDYRLVPIC